MNEVLEQAMAPVLQDLSGAGVAPARIEEQNWTDLEDRPSAMVRSTDGSGFGISVDRLAPAAERVAAIADQIQEWAIEQLWGTAATNWPRCPQHPDSHPMKATVQHQSAVWVCPFDERPISVIGSLRAADVAP